MSVGTVVDGSEGEDDGGDGEHEHVLELGKAGTLAEDDGGGGDAHEHVRFLAAAVGFSAAFASVPAVVDVQQASSVVPRSKLRLRPPRFLHCQHHSHWHLRSPQRPEPSSWLLSLTWSSLYSLLTAFPIDHDV